MSNIKEKVSNQREFFYSGETLTAEFRKKQLIKLLTAIRKNEKQIMNALKIDLNKSEFESYETEIGMVYEELKYMIRNVERLAKPKKRKTPIMHFPSTSYQYKDPYGVVLIMSPWNYPFQLAIAPLVGAIAAGNCIMVKPSNYSSATSKVIKDILSVYNPSYIDVVEGGREVNQQLLDEKFDYIFFTGSPTVGHLVMEKAAKHLTPITLELGGKSPCIIDKSANIDLAAKRFLWGKLLNSGQTCVAPDYILVHEDIKEQFVKAVKKYMVKFYGEHPETNDEYPKIINRHHFERLKALIRSSEQTPVCNEDTLQLAPIILENTNWDSEVMKEEIFGPIIPILTFKNLDALIGSINSRPKPLALYIFTTNKDVEKKILTRVFYGGGCVNDTIVHLANPNIPFGGVGNSGMGSYHGKESFNVFSHSKSILKKSNLIDINLRYAPYGDNLKWLRKILK